MAMATHPLNGHNTYFSPLQQTHDLHVGCVLCCRKKSEITLNNHQHGCTEDILLAKKKEGGNEWRRVSDLPPFPKPERYVVCRYAYKEGHGCAVHGRCTYAKSSVEADVWNFLKQVGRHHSELIGWIKAERGFPPKPAHVIHHNWKERIQQQFPGQFMELCETCFRSTPLKVFRKGNTAMCTSSHPSSHHWKPTLVHQRDKQYTEVRPLPEMRYSSWQYCKHVVKGEPCLHGAQRCWFAHSELEFTVWTAESSTEGFERPLLLKTVKKQQLKELACPSPRQQFNCQACKLQFSSRGCLMNHYNTLAHSNSMKLWHGVGTKKWKHRDPPQTNQTYKLCERASTCELGSRCVDAHSEEELREWRMQDKLARKTVTAAGEQGLLSYQDSLLREFRDSMNEACIMSEMVPGVTVSCNKELMISCQSENVPLQWQFKIQSEKVLVEVALLKQEPGASFELADINLDSCTYSTSERFYNTDDMTYDITVTFKSEYPGLYEQWLVFDFDTRPVLLQKLKVRVGRECDPQLVEQTERRPSLQRWHRGNREIIPCRFDETEPEKQLLKEYKPPQINLFKPLDDASAPMNHRNYKEKMHSFLYAEEQAEDQVISRLSIQGTVTMTDILFDDRFGMKKAPEGELFGAISVPYSLTPDTPEGSVFKRDVQSALVAPVSLAEQKCKVYEAIIVRDTTSENKMHFQLSEKCCSELNLQSKDDIEIEVQFKMNRLKFCAMHKAVDLLPDTERVLPDLGNCVVPVCTKQKTELGLNHKQQAAMDIIVGDGRGSKVPLLIYGPFGTGKTWTLATATKELVRQTNTKVLICTLTNSSADLYVKSHFHHAIGTDHGVKPLRIKAEEASVRSTDNITMQYCHLSKDGQSFSFPDKEVVDSHRVVITTTGVARLLHDLKLPDGYFTHILIDEASQMLECEALMPLALAGPNTQVVLAGDHMQMGPKLFSVEDHQRSNHTLLNRLFHYYQGKTCSAALKCRIIFNENYRSTKEIVEFVSTHFYGGKSDAIKAVGNVPDHPSYHSLRFHHVRGECHLDPTSMSWFNPEEAESVVEIVEDLLRDWPPTWGQQDPSSICVLSEGCQVSLIRNQFRRRQLHQVTVENIANVQGKQFRVIILTAIQTRNSLALDSPCLEFFNDARVLNTAMTRAQSQVVVVGDAAALCYFGKSSKIWKSYIVHCINKHSARPPTLTEDFLKQDLSEILRFMKDDREDNSDSESSTSEIPDIDDPILKELLDEDKDVRVDVTAEGLLDFIQGEQIVRNVDRREMEQKSYALDSELLQMDPSNYKRCTVIKEWFDSGYVIPHDEPSLRIDIKGRMNFANSFSGDQVLVQMLNNGCHPPTGKVLRVLNADYASKVFVCTIDDQDSQLMTPINKGTSKICTPFWKDKPNHIAVRRFEGQHLRVERFEKINEELKRNNLFVVKVLKWRFDQFRYPLGVVVKVLPKVTSLDAGLEVLDIEYRLQRDLPSSVEEDIKMFKDLQTDVGNRMDYREFATFTIDPAHSKDLDDAISVRDLGKCYEIGVHIADVASLVTKDCPLDKYAQQRGTTFYPPGKEPFYMFPSCLSTNEFSLLPGCERNAISFMVEIDKKTHTVKARRFALSVIRSDRQLSYDEVENILQIPTDSTQRFNTLEDCLAIAYHFSEVHRKARKQDDWYYKSVDEDGVIGWRRSHKMVEELMVMYNHAVADYLLSDAKTVNCTPIRCQDKPTHERLSHLKEKFTSVIPLSIHFTHCIANIDHNQRGGASNHGQAVQSQETFAILTSVMKCLESACKDEHIDSIVDLLATDDIHPQLLPLVIEFRKSMRKANVLRSNTCYLSRIGHYDLQLDSYTWASSPIRRYVDIIVQRALHSVLEKKAIRYAPREIDQSCLSFSQKSDQQSKYERTAHSLSLASQLNDQSARKMAFVIDVSPAGRGLKLHFPLNRISMPECVPVMYRDMQLVDQPEYNEEDNSVVLKWMKRVYSFTNDNIRTELQHQGPNPSVTAIPTNLWKSMMSAVKEENWEAMLHYLKIIINPQDRSSHSLTRDTPKARTNLNPDHFIELPLTLKPGETVEVQLGTDTQRGLLVPVVQMLIVRDKFQICLEHSKNPIVCFSKYALRSSRQTYTTYMEYQKIWKPLCEMESASNAVAENESIIIEDVRLTWKQKEQLCGSFQIPLEKMKQWAIESSLKRSFLCIRMVDQELENRGTSQNHQNTDLTDVTSPIWVAHGIITKATDEEEAKELTYMQFDFRINHMPMANIPDGVHREYTKFTVELIQKLLPDVRKEDAVTNLTRANQLVKDIALGKKTNCVTVAAWRSQARFEITEHSSVNFPVLNPSQVRAIREALENQFTLIQGPPGTGKTVVGVHLVYWFFKQNQSTQAHVTAKADDGSPKRRCILYCGPSNKSVDVVAGQLLKLKNTLKPLRVYGDQIEMLEFPYPGSNLKLSRRSVREEKPNRELSSITLHHLIRKQENPFSEQILSFDERIAMEDHLSDDEIKIYKSILSQARQHELMIHDVILCTCTAASNPNFSKLDLQQIIIDECAMATEPEALIPLVTHMPGKIVLLGDHKQLQPIVHGDLVAKLGMKKSLFERYMDKAFMLDTQYRMHEQICEFPSMEFYNGHLKTGVERRASVFVNKFARTTSILFGHVDGKEISLVVSTERGNENSKANVEEAEQVVRIASLLIKQARVKANDIAILTPYNAQVSKINETLSKRGVLNVNVSTITKSQGSEWRYVILSTVRSCPEAEIDRQPTIAWLKKKLGFIVDPNQVNVGITRAQEGLCIIGNKELLLCSRLWRNLLSHYQEHGCVVDHASDIHVQVKPKSSKAATHSKNRK